jgi:UDP-3-O-[3-hydroxymyristoyl] N-acetylglucosamine deacetylase
MVNETVLVVDDEERIRSSLRGILSDEGFRVIDTGDAPQVMALVEQEHPRLVLLDVWMPAVDGIELLRQIKAREPRVEVIMISGHGNIQSAVTATKLGAADFLEKPFSANSLLAAISRVLVRDSLQPAGGASKQAARKARSRTATTSAMARPQRTIAKSIVVGGQGLHSGFKTGVILHPSGTGTGISFAALSAEGTLKASIENVSDTGYNTTLAGAGYSIRTIEHLMSALHGAGITNLLVKTHAEIPALDGSAVEFCKLISEAGVQDQDAPVEPIKLKASILIGDEADGAEYIRIDPAEALIIDYTLDYPQPIGRQSVHFELTSFEDYAREIAPARTFTFVHEIKKLSEMGLASGGRIDNVILVDDEKVVNTKLRFPDEFARHKILDLIGDLYLLGRPLLGHITASKTGHSDNVALLRAVRKTLPN